MNNNKNTSSNANTTDAIGTNIDHKPNMQSDGQKSNSSDIESKIDADNPEVHQTQSFDMANDENAKDPGKTTNRLDKEIDSKVSENRPSNVGITSNEELNGR
ncbi:MAG: hypothetical protein ACTHJ5_18770 [Ilyomonas sp.]